MPCLKQNRFLIEQKQRKSERESQIEQKRELVNEWKSDLDAFVKRISKNNNTNIHVDTRRFSKCIFSENTSQ